MVPFCITEYIICYQPRTYGEMKLTDTLIMHVYKPIYTCHCTSLQKLENIKTRKIVFPLEDVKENISGTCSYLNTKQSFAV